MSDLFNKRYSIQPFSNFGTGSQSFEDELFGHFASSGLEETSELLQAAQENTKSQENTPGARHGTESSAAAHDKIGALKDDLEKLTSTRARKLTNESIHTAIKTKPTTTAPTAVVISTTEISAKQKTYERLHDDENSNSTAAKLRKKLMRRSVAASTGSMSVMGSKYSKPKSRLDNLQAL